MLKELQENYKNDGEELVPLELEWVSHVEILQICTVIRGNCH
jgi:hypothetical protein